MGKQGKGKQVGSRAPNRKAGKFSERNRKSIEGRTWISSRHKNRIKTQWTTADIKARMQLLARLRADIMEPGINSRSKLRFWVGRRFLPTHKVIPTWVEQKLKWPPITGSSPQNQGLCHHNRRHRMDFDPSRYQRFHTQISLVLLA